MIIVKIKGGLGNQMFQFACGYALAKKLDTELLFDLQSYTNPKEHGYQLDKLMVPQKTVTPKKVKSFLGKGISGMVSRLLSSKQTILLDENNFDVLTKNPDKNADYYLNGFWQSEKYFADTRLELFGYFKVSNSPDDANIAFLKQIETTDSVSLHIRRGDYVSNPSANEKHGLCSMEYYEKAIAFTAQNVKNPTFFIFSDDLEWVKENLTTGYETVYVDANSANTGYEDIRLMSRCRHNIIANSTFSWWGAWLNVHKDKIVIAPDKWFNDTKRGIGDIIPESWVRI